MSLLSSRNLPADTHRLMSDYEVTLVNDNSELCPGNLPVVSY